ncbi:MAG TPA: CidA/LrgA family protein [Pseudomonadales bacterium]|nr:CidA/LrgA family protein [Pseudomonadales bacterium]
MLRNLTLLLLFYVLGAALVQVSALPVPASICALLLLLIFLLWRGGASASMLKLSNKLFQHMPLFLIPGTVGITAWWPLLLEHGWALMFILVLSFVLTYFFVFALMSFLMRHWGKESHGD